MPDNQSLSRRKPTRQELSFAKIKQFLRTAQAQAVDTLIEAIAKALQTITPSDAIGFFTHAGFLNLD